MNQGYTVVWSFRNRVDVLIKSIETADKYFPKEVNFCLVDAASSEETIKKLRLFLNTIENRIVRVCESAFRTNLSEAWNLGMMLSDTRYVIFSSSDVLFSSPDLFPTITEFQRQNRSKYLLVENHSVFLIDKKIIPAIGWFDEDFVPGPHFDCDYMIRASEMGIPVHIMGNNGYYTHGDTEEVSIQRSSQEVPDRLPMHDFTNDRVFKDKWQSGWPGWEPYKDQAHKPHPPTHISQVLRKKSEIDPHPIFTKKYV
jgi:glycosyltransferase involved in cell wall biosynthesis